MSDPTTKPKISAKALPAAVDPAVPPALAAKPPKPAKPVVARTLPVTKPAAPAPKPVATKPVPAVAQSPVPAAAQSPVPAAAPSPATPIAAPPAALTEKEDAMETIENTAADASAKAQTLFADANDRAKGALEKGQKLFEEANSFGKGNLEAIVESSKIAAKGFEALGQDAAAYAKKSFEDATAAAKTLATVKSPTEFVKLQSDYLRTTFDALIAETSRSTEAMLKLAGEVAQPISSRVALAAEKVKIAA